MTLKAKVVLMQIVNEIVYYDSSDEDDVDDEHILYIAAQLSNVERRELPKVIYFMKRWYHNISQTRSEITSE